MAQPYNLALLTNSNGSFISILQALNVYCEGYLGLGILFMVFLFMMIAFVVYGQQKNWLISIMLCIFDNIIYVLGDRDTYDTAILYRAGYYNRSYTIES